VAVATAHLAAQASPQPNPPEALKGTWQFNKDLSKMPPEPPGSRGEGAGARGGRGGPPPDSEAARAQADLEKTPEMRQFRAAMKEIQPPPDILFISASPTEVTFVTKEGAVRKFPTDGVKQKMEISQSRMDVTTSWTPSSLTQDIVAGSLKIARTWVVSDDGTRLVITVRTEATSRPGTGVPMILVYTRTQ